MININNENLANYIMFKLDKLENEFTDQELDKITEIIINYDYENDSSFVFLEELLKLKKLQFITLRNGYVFDDNFHIFLELKDLVELTFENCEFEYADKIASLSLKSLSLINCKIESYSFINILNNLSELTIVNGEVETIKINTLSNLRYLQLSYSNIIGNEGINILSLEELYIDNTNLNNFNFLYNLPNLKKISIDEKQYNNNKELFDHFIKNNILVLNENMVEFAGKTYEV